MHANIIEIFKLDVSQYRRTRTASNPRPSCQTSLNYDVCIHVKDKYTKRHLREFACERGFEGK